ncbi:MAG: DNA-binding protein [Lutibacter sp.]|uniref:HU family DNA-binding protein n=1 Tax=Lutibacter sp. TaxID=1925666 RepID=UPI00385B33DF
MAIRYRITKRTNTINPTKESKYIMQAVSTGTIDSRRLSKEISMESTLSPTDVHAVLFALGEKLQFHLLEGKTVDLENIGKFKLGFKCKAEDEQLKLSPKRSILKYHLNFQPSVFIKRLLKKGITTYKEGSRSKD